ARGSVKTLQVIERDRFVELTATGRGSVEAELLDATLPARSTVDTEGGDLPPRMFRQAGSGGAKGSELSMPTDGPRGTIHRRDETEDEGRRVRQRLSEVSSDVDVTKWGLGLGPTAVWKARSTIPRPSTQPGVTLPQRYGKDTLKRYLSPALAVLEAALGEDQSGAAVRASVNEALESVRRGGPPAAHTLADAAPPAPP